MSTKLTLDDDAVAVFEPAKIYLNSNPELDEPIAAKQTRDRWRSEGVEPAYIRLGGESGRGRIGYYGRDLNAWLSTRRVMPSDNRDAA